MRRHHLTPVRTTLLQVLIRFFPRCADGQLNQMSPPCGGGMYHTAPPGRHGSGSGSNRGLGNTDTAATTSRRPRPANDDDAFSARAAGAAAVPVFHAVVTQHASDRSDPYLLATEPLVFPLAPKGTSIRFGGGVAMTMSGWLVYKTRVCGTFFTSSSPPCLSPTSPSSLPCPSCPFPSQTRFATTTTAGTSAGAARDATARASPSSPRCPSTGNSASPSRRTCPVRTGLTP